VVARLDDPQVKVEVKDILVCSGVPKEDAIEVVPIELAPTDTGTFNADASAKQLESSNIRFTTAPRLVGGLANGGMHQAIMEIRRMYQSR
jgi:hypothetical protein